MIHTHVYETQNSTKQILQTWKRCQGVTAILFCCLRLCPAAARSGPTGARTGVLEGVIWNQSCHSWLPRQPSGAHACVRERTVGRIINMHKLEEPGRGFNCVCRRVKLRLMEGIQNYREEKGEAELAESVAREIIRGHFIEGFLRRDRYFCCAQGMTNNLKNIPNAPVVNSLG